MKTTINSLQDRYQDSTDRLNLSRSPHTLARIYVEVTNRCNLNCSMCIRNNWNHELGSMSRKTLLKMLSDIQSFSPFPEIFFGGYGEPLSHPEIINFVQDTKKFGARTSLVTNGTLLSPELSKDLILSGLNQLWVSLDGMHHDNPKNDVMQKIIHNLEIFQDLKSNPQLKRNNRKEPEVGIVYVLTKTNSSDLLDLFDLGKDLGVKSFFITYLEAFSEEMAGEIPYQVDQWRNPLSPSTDQSTLTDLIKKLQSVGPEIIVEGSLTNPSTRCPFAERGEIALRWDGEVSPCLPLLYNHTSIVGKWKSQVYSYSLGNINSKSFQEIWFDQEFEAFTKRLLEKDFSPCLNCRDCWLSEDNRLDCMGYEHPTCGGCLWAHGVIACP